MYILRIRQAREHLLEAEDIAAKLQKYPNSEHAEGWVEDMHAEIDEARRLLLLKNKAAKLADIMQVAA